MQEIALATVDDIALLPLQSSGDGLGGIVLLLLLLGLFLVPAIGMWKTFAKAGKPGWGAFIPILNLFYLVEMTEKPTWWVIVPIIPIVGWLLMIVLFVDVAKQFGKGAGTGVGLALLPFIFWPLLGFGDAQYRDTTGVSV